MLIRVSSCRSVFVRSSAIAFCCSRLMRSPRLYTQPFTAPPLLSPYNIRTFRATCCGQSLRTNFVQYLSSLLGWRLSILCRVKADLQRDLNIQRKLAYRRVEKVGALLKQIHAIRSKHPDHPSQPAVEIIRRWLLMPFTLWPVVF